MTTRNLIALLYACVGGIAGTVLLMFVMLVFWGYELPWYLALCVLAATCYVGWRAGLYVADGLLP